MSCISVHVGVQGAGGVSVDIPKRGGVKATVLHGSCSASVVTGGRVRAVMLGGMVANAYLVCEAGKAPYLLVNPKEPVWVSVETSGTYDVRSNTDWIVQ